MLQVLISQLMQLNFSSSLGTNSGGPPPVAAKPNAIFRSLNIKEEGGEKKVKITRLCQINPKDPF